MDLFMLNLFFTHIRWTSQYSALGNYSHL